MPAEQPRRRPGIGAGGDQCPGHQLGGLGIAGCRAHPDEHRRPRVEGGRPDRPAGAVHRFAAWQVPDRGSAGRGAGRPATWHASSDPPDARSPTPPRGPAPVGGTVRAGRSGTGGDGSPCAGTTPASCPAGTRRRAAPRRCRPPDGTSGRRPVPTGPVGASHRGRRSPKSGGRCSDDPTGAAVVGDHRQPGRLPRQHAARPRCGRRSRRRPGWPPPRRTFPRPGTCRRRSGRWGSRRSGRPPAPWPRARPQARARPPTRRPRARRAGGRHLRPGGGLPRGRCRTRPADRWTRHHRTGSPARRGSRTPRPAPGVPVSRAQPGRCMSSILTPSGSVQ